jgi:hypothetical protein
MVRKTVGVSDVPVEETPSTPDFKLKYRIETPNGEYYVKRPVGRAGVVHFTLVTKCIPSQFDEQGKAVISPADQERFSVAFAEWSEKVLPAIFIEGPNGIKVEEMPGEDQYALFLAMFSTVNLSHKDLFRFIE